MSNDLIPVLWLCGPPAVGKTTVGWKIYSQLIRGGIQALVMVGPVEDEAAVAVYADALPTATITLCRLHAERDQLAKRIMQRGQGGSWPQPGDPLRGQSMTHLLRIVDQALADAEALERAAIGLRIDTDRRAVKEVADLVHAQSGWPGRIS